MSEEIRITEGVMGTFHYHLSKGDSHEGLCGASIMATRIPLSAWGVKTLDGHIREYYCPKCEAMTRPAAKEER